MSNNKSDKERTGLYWYQLLELRARVLFEQDFGCGECGNRIGLHKGDAHLHHIDENPKHNYRGNLLVLCPSCHATEHGYDPSHFDNLQPLYNDDYGTCQICGAYGVLKDNNLCCKCFSEHYSSFK